MAIRNNISAEELSKLQKEIFSLGRAVELLGCHAIITDANANILYANKQVERQTGYSVAEVIGKNPGDLWGGRMTDDVYEKMWHTIKDEKTLYVGEVKNVKKDGTEYWQEIIISPILDEKGAVKFFVSIEPDITQRKDKEILQREFMSLLAHQLRNPLTAIRWLTETLIKEDELKERQLANIEEIAKHDHALIDLISDFLIVTRVGRTAEKEEQTDLADEIGRIVERVKAQNPGVEFNKDYSGVFPYKTLAKTLMLQVFENLISNAACYCDPTNGEVRLLLKKYDDNYVFSVSNNGPAIATEDQSLIFTKLHRGANAIERNTPGSGLGLYIVKIISENFGWQVTFKSPDENGLTSFMVTLPLIGKTKK